MTAEPSNDGAEGKRREQGTGSRGGRGAGEPSSLPCLRNGLS